MIITDYYLDLVINMSLNQKSLLMHKKMNADALYALKCKNEITKLKEKLTIY